MFGLSRNSVLNTSDISTILKYTIPMVLGAIFSTDIGVNFKKIADEKVIVNFH